MSVVFGKAKGHLCLYFYDRGYAVGINSARKLRFVKSLSEKTGKGLFQPQFLRDFPSCLLKGKPSQIILQIPFDIQGLSNLFGPVLAQLFNLVIMFVEKRMGVRIPDHVTGPA